MVFWWLLQLDAFQYPSSLDVYIFFQYVYQSETILKVLVAIFFKLIMNEFSISRVILYSKQNMQQIDVLKLISGNFFHLTKLATLLYPCSLIGYCCHVDVT